MCILCSKPIFPDIHFGDSAKAKAMSRAIRLKNEIQEHERIIAEAKQKGETPCPATVQRLESLRAQQYEVNQLI